MRCASRLRRSIKVRAVLRSTPPSLPVRTWSVKSRAPTWYAPEVGRDAELPIFPLASVVLFPQVRAPLHMFEPRYRQLTRDALAGDRRIGMIAVLPDHVSAMAGEPPTYSVGCAAIIEAAERLTDGRYNIVLLGTRRFRKLRERTPCGERLYRVAEVELLEDPHPPGDRSATAELRGRVLDRLAELLQRRNLDVETQLDPLRVLDDAQFVNTLANGFDFAPREKQSLLEAGSIRARFEQLSELLDFALMELETGRTPNSGPLH